MSLKWSRMTSRKKGLNSLSDTQPFTKTRFKRRRSNLRISTMEEHEAENPTVITAENFHSVFSARFAKLSKEQLDGFYNCDFDPEVIALLKDLNSAYNRLRPAMIQRPVQPENCCARCCRLFRKSPRRSPLWEFPEFDEIDYINTEWLEPEDDSDSMSLEESPATSSNSVPTSQPRVNLSPEKSSARSRRSAARLRSESMSPEESKQASLPGASKGRISQPSPSEKYEQGLSQVSVSSFDVEKISKNLTSFLLIRIITKSRKQHLLSSKETKMVLDRLQDLVNQQISNIEYAGNLEDSMHQFTKSLSKRLIKEFGSPDKVLEAAMAYDLSFDEALLRNLKLDLGILPSPSPKKSKISRFFSAVGKALLKPFRCCREGSND